jgi:putative transposase
MKRDTTCGAATPHKIVEDAWEAVGASFERFCLSAGIAALSTMMEQDAAALCGSRHGREAEKAGPRWGKTQGPIGFHGGKIIVERPRVRAKGSKTELALPSWSAAVAEDWLGQWAKHAGGSVPH